MQSTATQGDDTLCRHLSPAHVAPLDVMEWNGMENGMEWNGMGWDGMECMHDMYDFV